MSATTGMRAVLRVIAVWMTFNGLLLVALAATHVDLVDDHLGQPQDWGSTAVTAALLLGSFALGALALYSAWALWTLRNRGRILGAVLFSIWTWVLCLGSRSETRHNRR